MNRHQAHEYPPLAMHGYRPVWADEVRPVRWRPSERTRVVMGHLAIAVGIFAVLVVLGALEALIG